MSGDRFNAGMRESIREALADREAGVGDELAADDESPMEAARRKVAHMEGVDWRDPRWTAEVEGQVDEALGLPRQGLLIRAELLDHGGQLAPDSRAVAAELHDFADRARNLAALCELWARKADQAGWNLDDDGELF